MAWIESHQSLANHPKTLKLCKELHCRVPAAIGYLHLLWWWTLEYAPSGQLPDEFRETSARFCHWSGPTSVFWSALVSAGFVDECPQDKSLMIHDWREYAGRLLDRRRKDADRKRVSRGQSAGRPQDVHASRARDRTVPNHVVVGGVKASGLRTHEPGPIGPLARSKPEPLGNGAQQCPICRQAFTGEYLEHTAEQHKVRPEPEDFGRGKPPTEAPSIPGVTLTDAMTVAELQDSLREQHEQYLARERQNHA